VATLLLQTIVNNNIIASCLYGADVTSAKYVNNVTPARFEAFTPVTMKNAVSWDVEPCECYEIRRFGGKCRLYLQDKNQRAKKTFSS
jgi:hypothetical protein